MNDDTVVAGGVAGVDLLVAHVRDLDAAPALVALLERLLVPIAALAPAEPHYLAFAPLVLHACGGDATRAVPLAALTSSLWRGFDILDDVADGDAPRNFPGESPSQLTLAAGLLIAGVAHDLVARLDLSDAAARRVHETIARRCGQMIAGQSTDLAQQGAEMVALRDVLASVRGKAGAQFALYAEIAAAAAGASAQQTDAVGRFGEATGTALQLLSDVYDAFLDPQSRDILGGIRTYPIVAALHANDRARTDVLALLQPPIDVIAVREVLIRSGALRETLIAISLHRLAAAAALAEAGVDETARAPLERWITAHYARLDALHE